MAQLAGDTEMANVALGWLGTATRLSNIGQPGPVAAAARDSLLIQVPAIMQQHPWNFAVTRQSIPSTVAIADEVAEYAWSYQLPPDCLSWLPWRRGDVHYFAAEQEGDLLLSNSEGPVIVRYIRHVADRSKWSALFVTAVTAQLAFDLCEAVAASQSIRDRMSKRFDEAMADAKRADALATGRVDRPAPADLSSAVAAMGRHGRGDPTRWHQ